MRKRQEKKLLKKVIKEFIEAGFGICCYAKDKFKLKRFPNSVDCGRSLTRDRFGIPK